jgi:hypothetical protein
MRANKPVKNTKKSYTVTLTMSRELAIHLSQACEVIARCGFGQYKSLVELIAPDKSYEEGIEIEKYLRHNIKRDYTDSRKDNLSCEVAWDAYQYLRREIAWSDLGKDYRTDKRDWNTMNGVIYDDPMPRTAQKLGDFSTGKK